MNYFTAVLAFAGAANALVEEKYDHFAASQTSNIYSPIQMEVDG